MFQVIMDFFMFILFSTLTFQVKGISVESIPGLNETGWRPLMRTPRTGRIQEENTDPDKLAVALKQVLVAVKKQDWAWPFLEPVDIQLASDYYDKIKYPMGEINFLFI